MSTTDHTNRPFALDDQNPWPGLAAYDEAASDFFHGRDADADELLRLVQLAPLTVLYGKSGLGKSSLLQAGLFPRLRQAHYLPIYIRLHIAQTDEHAPLDQAAQRLREELAASEADCPAFEPGENLWRYLHRRELELWSQDNNLLTPVLVFDQFEELFPHGGFDVERVRRVRHALADLIENRIPTEITSKEDGRRAAARLDVFSQRYRVILSFREDFLPDIKNWERDVPSLLKNWRQLQPMNREQAVAAAQSGAAVLAPGAADAIVDFVGNLDQARTEGDNSIEPVLLSLCCYQLNLRRQQRQAKLIDATLVGAEGQDILQDFYTEALGAMPDTVSRFIEDHLIQGNRYRGSYPKDEAIAQGFVTPKQLDELTSHHRLLRINQQRGTACIELIHDRLVDPVRQARDLRLTAEEQREREKKLQRDQAQARDKAMRRGLLIATVFALIALGAAVFAFQKGRESERLRQEQVRQERLHLSESAKLLLASDQRFDALILSIQAGKTLKDIDVPPQPGFPERVRGLLQQSLSDTVQERNRIEGSIVDTTFSPDNKLITTASKDGAVTLWNMTGEKLKVLPHDGEVSRVMINPGDGQTIATVIRGAIEEMAKAVTLWRIDGEKIKTFPHDGFIDHVFLSPDGQRVATVSADYTVKLWRTDRKEPKTIPSGGFVYELSFSPDGKTIAIASEDGVVLWSKEDEKLNRLSHDDAHSVGFSPDGQRIVTASFNGDVKLWSIDGKALKTLPHKDSVDNVSFGPDSQTIVTTDGKGVAWFWRMDGEKATKLDHEGEVMHVRFNPAGQTIATVSKDKTVKLWNRDGQHPKTLSGHLAPINSISFSPDGQMIATAGIDKTVKLWRLGGRELATLQHYQPVLDVRFSPDSQTIATVNKDNTVKFWSLDSPEFNILQGHIEPVNLVHFSPDGQIIATASYDSTVRLWSPDGQERSPPLKHDHWIYGISFSPDGQTMATDGHEGLLRLWSLDGKPLGSPRGEPSDTAASVSFSPDGNTIATGMFDGSVHLWSRDGKEPKILTGHEDMVTSISFSPDGQTMATGSWDRTVRLWSRDGKALKKLDGHDDSVISVRFSPDSTIITVSRDGTVKRWRRDGEELNTIKYDDVFESVHFSPDGKIIASTNGGNTVQLWSDDGEKLTTLLGHGDSVMSVHFSPDGRTLATASADTSVRLWNLDVDKWVSLLDKNLDELMIEACNVVRNYLKNTDNKSHSNLCNDITP